MNKISNALIIDDKSDLILADNEATDKYEYNSLQSIKNFFLKNSIPFSIINNTSISIESIGEQIKLIPKPDLVVLDLDLNANGYVDDYDEALLVFILQELAKNYGFFMLLIYSSQYFRWDEIKHDLIAKNSSLEFLLIKDNVIVQEKKDEFDAELKNKLRIELKNKSDRYFKIIKQQVSTALQYLWNKEAVLFSLFFIVLLSLMYFSLPGLSRVILFSSILIIILVAIRFIIPDNPKK